MGNPGGMVGARSLAAAAGFEYTIAAEPQSVDAYIGAIREEMAGS